MRTTRRSSARRPVGDGASPRAVTGSVSNVTAPDRSGLRHGAAVDCRALSGRDAVYQVYVRSFVDTDGDGLGDLPGIRTQLPYVRGLGVDALWLTPFYPTPDADHGYDVSDHCAVDPRFGTLSDLDGLVEDAHDLGLRVLIDVVPNHTSNEHRWSRSALADPSHPDRRRYVFRPGRDGGPPNRWTSAFGGSAWTLDDASGEWYLHFFAPQQPDLDWHDDWDADELTRTIDRTLTAFAAVGAAPCWVLENHDAPRLPTRYGGGAVGRRRARAAALLLLALPGSAFVYQGQELGLEEVNLPEDVLRDPAVASADGVVQGRDGCRVPLPWRGGPPSFGFSSGQPWLPMPASWAGATVEDQADDPASVLTLFRLALACRPTGAGFAWRTAPSGALAFDRDDVTCVVNFDAPSVGLPPGEVIAVSDPDVGRDLPPATAAWVRRNS